MADITKCNGQDCPIKEKCYRFTAPDSLIWQSWFAEKVYEIKKGIFSCEMFWGQESQAQYDLLNEIMKSDE